MTILSSETLSMFLHQRAEMRRTQHQLQSPLGSVQAVLQDIALKWRGAHNEDSLGHQTEPEQTWEMSEGPLLSPTQKANLVPLKIEVK